MKRVGLCVSLFALALSALTSSSAFAQGPPGGLRVNVVNTPLTVQGIVSVAAGDPVNARDTASGTSNQTDAFPYTIPAGKVLIIEYLSASAQVPAGETVWSMFISFPVVHYFVVASQGPTLGGRSVFTAAQSLRIALGPFATATVIRVRMEKNVGGTPSTFDVTLAGQLLDP